MTWNSVEKVAFSNIGANTAPFTLRGGQYGIDATFTGGSVTVEKLAGDGVAWIPVMDAFAGPDYGTVNLPSGTYRVNVGAATQVYIVITGVITTM